MYKVALFASINKKVAINPNKPNTPMPSMTSCARLAILALKFCGIQLTASAEPKNKPRL